MANKHIKNAQHNITTRKANQNHNELSSHTHGNGHHQKVYKQMLEMVQRKGNPLNTVGENVNWHSHYGDSMETPYKTGNRTAIQPSNPTTRHML